MTSQVEATRLALLQAGVRLYGSRSADLLKVLTAGTVAEEAGFHRQTFYRYWESQGDYVVDLILWLLSEQRTPALDGVETVPEHRRGSLDDFVKGLALHDVSRVLEDPTIGMRIGLLMMHALDDGPVKELSARYYDATMVRLAAVYDDLLDGWGREMVPGTTTRDLARTLQALCLGFAIQLRVAPDDPPAVSLAERAARDVVEAMTRPVKAR